MLEFLIAIAGGFAVPYLDKPVSEPAAKAIEGAIKVEQAEIRLLSLLIAMLATGLVIAAIGHISAFGFGLGIGLGYFGLRIVAAVRRAVEGRKPDA